MQRTEMRVDGLKVAKRRLALPPNGKRPVSQAVLAERAGIHWVTVSNIERGKAQNTTIDTLGRLAQALHCEVADLIVDDAQEASDDDEDDPSMSMLRALHSQLGAVLEGARS